CRMHGGGGHPGISNGNFKHGRYSRYLPANLLETYERTLADPDRIALADELALLDSRIAQLIGRLDREGGASWLAAHATFEHLRTALRRGGSDGASSYLDELGAILKTGAGEHRAWQQLH